MRIVAAHIEGLGQIDGSGASGGYLLTGDLPSGFDDTTDSYDWRPVMVQPPTADETRVEPYEPAFRMAPFDLTLSAGRQQDWLVELLLHKDTSAAARVDEPGATLSSSDTTITVTSASPFSTGDVIYIGAETIKVTGISGSDLTVTRGYYGSEGATHASDAAIYTRPPFFEGRRVIVYTYDTHEASPSLVSRQRGIIDGKITMGGARLFVPVMQMLAPLYGAKVNRDPLAAIDSDLSKMAVPDDAERYAGLEYLSGVTRTAADESDSSRVLKSGTGATSQYWDVGGELYTSNGVGGGPLRYRPLSSGPRDVREIPGQRQGVPDTGTYPVEVFAVTRAMDEASGEVLSSTYDFTNLPATWTSGSTIFVAGADMASTYLYHPLAIFGALTLSTERTSPVEEEFDILHPNMSFDLRYLFADDIEETLHTLIQDSYGQTQQVSRFVIGAGGEPVDLLQKLQAELLNPYDYKLAPDQNGKLTVYRNGLPDVGDYASARDNEVDPIGGADGVYVVDNGQGSAVDVITANVGKTAYTEGRSVTLEAEDGQPRRRIQIGGPSAELNLATLDPVNAEGVARNIIASRALAQHFAMKRLRVRVPDWQEADKDYSLGQHVTLSDVQITDAWLVDKNGNRTATITNGVQWVGQIIGSTPYDSFAGFELELLIQSDAIIRYRAPSGVVSSATSTTVVLESSDFNAGANGSDAGNFNSGDELHVYQTNGAGRDLTGKEISSVSGNTITVSSAWSTQPEAGDYVRLADYGTYDNDTVDTYTERVYVYLSDASATLGGADDDSDIYGL